MRDAADAAATQATPEKPERLFWMLIFFVLSGLSGLVYQSLWTQYLSLILGSSAYAQSLVLSIFMGGMAAGAWLSSRLLHRMRNLLLAYGLIEGVVGLMGLAFHALFLAVSHWLYTAWLPGLESDEAIGLSRWAVAAALILPQTLLLGMTFPIMSAGLMRWMPQRAGAVLGGLYFFNSIGAAFGALLATFVLVPAGGLPGAMGFAGILNVLIFAGVWLAKVPARAEAAQLSTDAPKQAPGERDRIAVAVLAIAGLTGLSSFMYEVGWIRMLSLALGTSQHAFELMLAAFIGGLALGGLYVRGRLDRIADPLRYAGWIQVLMGLAALATLPLYDHSFVFVSGLLNTLAPSSTGYVFYNIATASVAIVIMLPAAFFAGMTLPVLTYVLLRRGRGERAIGQAYAINTVGAILGVLIMVHFAMPALGLKLAMVLAASIDLLLGLVLLKLAGGLGVSRRLVLATGYCVGMVALVMVTAQFDPMRLNSGVYRTRIAEIDASKKILYQADGKTASIALHGIPGESLTIATNGKPDASINMNDSGAPSQDEPTMIMLALTGLAANPNAKDIANIGFGSGLTTHVFASSPTLSSITTVEIEPRMIDAARGFGDRVKAAFEDPRSTIVIDDARAYFSGKAAQYDIIVSEPSNPWVAGVAKLFSKEFYAFVKRHLREGGLLVQWVQAYEISDATLLTVLRALDGEFSDYALYLSNNTDIIIIATPMGRLPPMSGEVLGQAELEPLARIAGLRSLEDLLERKLADRARIQPLLKLDGGPANSDYYPVLGDAAPRDRYMRERAGLILSLYRSPLGVLELAGPGVRNSRNAYRTPAVEMELVNERRRAEGLLAALLDRPAPGERVDEPRDLRWSGHGQRLRELGATCFAGATPGVANRLLIEAFDQTAPYVDTADLHRAFVDRSWVSCAISATPPPPVVRVLEALSALADPGSKDLSSLIHSALALSEQDLEVAQRKRLAHADLLGARRAAGPEAVEERLQEQLTRLEWNAAERFELKLTARTLSDSP